MELAKRGKAEGGGGGGWLWVGVLFRKWVCTTVQVGRSRGDRNKEKERIHLGNKQYG